MLGLPGNANDLYLFTPHEVLWSSPVYRSKKGTGLPFLADFHLHFSESGAKSSRISVKAYRPEVIHGKSFGMSHAGPRWLDRYVSVDSTTIEEYKILRYIGDFVGQSNMPPVIVPGNRSSGMNLVPH